VDAKPSGVSVGGSGDHSCEVIRGEHDATTEAIYVAVRDPTNQCDRPFGVAPVPVRPFGEGGDPSLPLIAVREVLGHRGTHESRMDTERHDPSTDELGREGLGEPGDTRLATAKAETFSRPSSPRLP
jgi:hypothetical protein